MRADGPGWTFTLGDVCGKGVEAAVLTGQVRQSIRTVSLVSPDPVTRLELLNSTLLSTHGTSFVTGWAARSSPRRLGPDFTGLSCSVPTALRRARAMIEASREAGIPVLVGGLLGYRFGHRGDSGLQRRQRYAPDLEQAAHTAGEPAVEVGVVHGPKPELPGIDRPQRYLMGGLDAAGQTGPLGSPDPD